MNSRQTVQQYILGEIGSSPNLCNDLSVLFGNLMVAAKVISKNVNRAGVAKGVLGETDNVNVHGEVVTKLDEFAQEIICQTMSNCGQLCVMASEESEEVIPLPTNSKKGKYVLLFDPLDGSSNIDVNTSIGTIFSIHRKVSESDDGLDIDCLQVGSKQIAAGYFIYGSSTMMVYTIGKGVNGFTLDPSIGEFLLSHENIQTPKRGKIYSINEGNLTKWDDATKTYVSYLKEHDAETSRPYSLRYIGSLVADFHRNLLKGGIFLYPGPKPKLRLLYEAAPLAFLVEQAAGLATTGTERILDIEPTLLHQRVPLIIGSHDDVVRYTEGMARVISPPAAG